MWPDCRCDPPCSNRGDLRLAATAVLCDIGGHDVVLKGILRSFGADVDSGELPPVLFTGEAAR